jgi:hypothetical protein
MEPVRFRRYVGRLVEGLAADPRVLGVVGLGSTAMNGREPDRWSDHDVWVVVADGAEEEYRTDPSWLPDAGRLVLWFRETPHGMKGVYDDGHLVEAAVFRADELSVTRANVYRVFLDRERITERMAEIRTETVAERAGGRARFLAGQFLTNLLVGVARSARGERLSGHDFVRAQAAGNLLALIAEVVPPQRSGVLDDLSPWRRFEGAYPRLADRVEHALREPVPEAALALLELFEREVVPRWDDDSSQAVEAVRSWIEGVVLAGEWRDAGAPSDAAPIG